MKITLTYIAVIIALTAVCVFAIKACSDRISVVHQPTFTESQVDSVLKNYEEANRVIDELTMANKKVQLEKDSLVKITAATTQKLEIQSLKASVLAREVQLARGQIKDLEGAGQEFIDYARACDSLVPQVDSLVSLVNISRVENRALQNSYDSLLSNTSLRLGRAEFDRDFYKEKFDTLSKYTLVLEKDKVKSDRKADKKIIFGPSVGATYYDKQVRPFVGVGFTYKIFAL